MFESDTGAMKSITRMLALVAIVVGALAGAASAQVAIRWSPPKRVDGAAGTTPLSALACPSASLCIGVDGAGAVLRTSTPAGPASGWERRVQPAASTLGLTAISCPDTSFCAAAGGGGELLTSETPGTAGPWKSTKLPFGLRGQSPKKPGALRVDLDAISCPSQTLCVATAGLNRLFVSTRPTGGPSTWRRITVPGTGNFDFFDAVSCPRTTLCIAVDGNQLAISTAPARPRSWKLVELHATVGSFFEQPSTVDAVACTPGLCLAAAEGIEDGIIFRSTNPAGGAKTFTHVRISTHPIVDLSCGSASLCVAIDSAGRAWSSTDPAGPASAWHPATLDSRRWLVTPSHDHVRLTAVACAPTTVCVAGDGGGRVYSGQ